MPVSDLTTTEDELLETVLNGFDGFTFDPLTQTHAQFYAQVLNDRLGGSSYSENNTSDEVLLALLASDMTGSTVSQLLETESELLAVVANAIGEVGAPEWVPENAYIHIDLVGGDPQGRAWVSGTGVVAVDTLLGGDPNTDNYWGLSGYDADGLTADGYTQAAAGAFPALIGAARTLLLGSATVRMKCKQVASTGNSNIYLVLASAGGDAALQTGLEGSNLEFFSQRTEITATIPNVKNNGIGQFNVMALTMTDDRSRFEIAANGSDAEETDVSPDDEPSGVPSYPLVAALVDVRADNALQSITLYDPLPSTDGLSELSEV